MISIISVTIEQNGAAINVIEGGCYSETLGASRDFLGVLADDKVEFRLESGLKRNKLTFVKTFFE